MSYTIEESVFQSGNLSAELGLGPKLFSRDCVKNHFPFRQEREMAPKRTCLRSTGGHWTNGEASIDLEEGDVPEEEHSLIPGIPNEITVFHILAKLPWTAMFPISRVNNRWRRLVKSRKVYDARVKNGYTQTLLPIMHRAPMFGTPAMHFPPGKWDPVIQEESIYSDAMSLYDPVTGSWDLLPPVPSLLAGIPQGCGCVCLSGKVYVLGGVCTRPNVARDEQTYCLTSLDNFDERATKEVYSLDLAAGDTTWKKCADMTYARAGFHCGVQDENIYVFWGVNRLRRTELCHIAGDTAVVTVEVYDPEEDLWDVVAPVPLVDDDVLRYFPFKTFAAVGDTFVTQSYFHKTSPSLFVEHIYDTDKDEWKVFEHVSGQTDDPTSVSVTKNQNVYSIDTRSLELKVYDETSAFWTSTACSSVIWRFLNQWVEPMPFRRKSLSSLEIQSCDSLFDFYQLCRSVEPDHYQPTLKNVTEVLGLAVVSSNSKGVTVIGLTRTTDIDTPFKNYPKQLALFKGQWSGEDQPPVDLYEIECPHALLDWQNYLCPLDL